MNKKLLKLFIIPLFVTLIYFVLASIPYFTHFGITSVVEEKNVNFENNIEFGAPLLKNKKATGIFKASENNLGVLLVRFVKFGRGSDTLTFRLKKEDDGKWYYENKYFGELFQNSQYFPFGFPIISNSKNNSYIFEIKSLSGKSQNGVGVSKNKPQTAFVYRYSEGELKNPGVFFSFTFKKSVYILKNIDYFRLAGIFVLSTIFVFLAKKNNITLLRTIRFLLVLKKRSRRILERIINKTKSYYLLIERRTARLSRKLVRKFTSTKIYLLFLNSNRKKRIVISLLVFLLALTYRFSTSLVDQSSLFYAGLGGQGDYDQFIRAATCAVRSFYSCPLVLHQNLLVESSILGTFYEIFGFTGGLGVYLYFMLILSSIVATLPYVLLSRKNWISVGGVIGGLFLATSDFLTHVALSFPPDNGSTFTFSIFFIVYLLTLNLGTIRWLLFFGLMGLIDGMNKALFLINDLAVFVLFIPVFFYEKVKSARAGSRSASSGQALLGGNIKILLISLIPLLVFLTIYLAWEHFVYAKWAAYYFLRSLVENKGASFISYTSFSGSYSGGSVVSQLLYLCVSAIVMLKRLITYADLQIIFLSPIFFGLLFVTFAKPPFDKLRARKFPLKEFILAFTFSVFVIALLLLTKNNNYEIHRIFEGEYIFANWTYETYIKIFLLSEIIFLFILNFKYSVIKLSLPIAPYVIMLIILTKNSPFPRISTQVVVWMIILLAFLIEWIMTNIDHYSRKRIRIKTGFLLLVLFIGLYIVPKTAIMVTQLSSGFDRQRNETKYLQWVNSSLPDNAIVLAGGKSDLVVLVQNVKRPIIYSSLYSAALLIRPNEIPGINPTDFTITGELQNKSNFKRNKYIILEDDVYIWRDRLTGPGDGVFTADPKASGSSALQIDDYSIKVYKSNSFMNKGIYELVIK